MKKSAALIAIFSIQIFFAQATRFIYHVSMKPDSTNRNDIKTETAYLDATPLKSVFYSENRLKRDSLMQRARQTGSFDRSQMQDLRSNMDFTVEKDFKEGTKTLVSRIARDQYSYQEDRPMDWKILPETTTIGDYKTQKAETQFGGRTWFAWFTTDVPFQDGPYKFSGLPGLIVKVEDSKGDYAFDLKETRNIETAPVLGAWGNIIKVKRQDFEKQNALYRKDPASYVQASMGARRGGGMRNSDPNQRKQMADRLAGEVRKSNNPIEMK